MRNEFLKYVEIACKAWGNQLEIVSFTLVRIVLIVIRLFDIALFWHASLNYWKRGGVGFRGTRISSVKVLTISSHVIVLRLWLPEKVQTI